MKALKLVGIADGDPLDRRTWSGSSFYFFEAIRRKGWLAGELSGNPGSFTNRFHQVANFTLPLKNWRFKYHTDIRHYRAMTRKVRRGLDEIKEDYTHVLQIYSHYDVPSLLRNRKIVCAYQDGNLARRLDSPFGYPAVSRKHIKKAMEWEKRIFGSLDHIFTFSSWLRYSFIHDYGVEPARVHVVGAGANLPPIEMPAREYDGKTILFSGVHFERKGGAILLDSFRQVKRALPDVRLVIIGPQRIHNLPEGVECLGYISKDSPQGIKRIRQAYMEASIFVMPSLYEPFGVVFLEAMAHRLPCIGTRNCAIPEIIEDGRTGYLVPVNDSDGLAEKIIFLLQRLDLLREMGNAGYERYRKLFSWERVVSRMATALGVKGVNEEHKVPTEYGGQRVF